MNREPLTNAEGEVRELTADDFARAKPLREANPELFNALQNAKRMRAGGRPKSNNPKKSTTIRFSPEVTDFFKAQGKGWQTRIDNVLKEYVAQHS